MDESLTAALEKIFPNLPAGWLNLQVIALVLVFVVAGVQSVFRLILTLQRERWRRDEERSYELLRQFEAERAHRLEQPLTPTGERDPIALQAENNTLTERLSDALTQIQRHKDYFSIFEQTRMRLERESERLGRDAWLNLFIGMIFAGFGIYVLLQGVLGSTAQSASHQFSFSTHDIARISLGVFVNIGAFFFFRLYLANQTDIRLNKNELTTVEMRITALRVALIRDDVPAITAVLTNLATTERNRILSKGQRAIAESTANDQNEIVDAVVRTISQFKANQINER